MTCSLRLTGYSRERRVDGVVDPAEVSVGPPGDPVRDVRAHQLQKVRRRRLDRVGEFFCVARQTRVQVVEVRVQTEACGSKLYKLLQSTRVKLFTQTDRDRNETNSNKECICGQVSFKVDMDCHIFDYVVR